MKRTISLFLFCLAIISCFLISGCSSPSANSDIMNTPSVETPPMESVELPEVPLIDYVDIHRNPSMYDGMKVRVAGRITDFAYNDDYSFYFNERLGTEEDRIGFEITLNDDATETVVTDLFEIGTYVVVEGIYHSGTYASLRESTILSSGDPAKEISDNFTDAWVSQRISLSESIPLTDYMDIVNSLSTYDGQYVRIAGKINGIGTNKATYHTYFRFLSREDNLPEISISLKGCPQEMQNLCIEDAYVVLSGLVENFIGSPKLTDCYVETVGPEAQAMANAISEEWLIEWQHNRTEFIETCTEYTYEEYARYPENYLDQHLTITGVVLQATMRYGANVVLLDVGNDNIVYVDYIGKQARDPELLVGDIVTFYGIFAGQTTYRAVPGTSDTVPHLDALYSSINQS